jgi:hypothetical protein
LPVAGVGGRTVEGHSIYNSLDPNTATDQLSHRVGNVFVVAPKAIHPPNHQCVAPAQDIEKSATFWAFTQASGYAGHAMVRQHQIRRKSNLERLGALVVERLIDSANPTIQNCFHSWLLCPLGCRPRGDVSADASLASAVGKAKVFLVPPRLCPCGRN